MASTQKTNYRQYSQTTQNVGGYARDNYTGGRANSASTGDQQSAQDWNSLQDELENLLDQVQMHQHDKFEYEQNRVQEARFTDQDTHDDPYDEFQNDFPEEHLQPQNYAEPYSQEAYQQEARGIDAFSPARRDSRANSRRQNLADPQILADPRVLPQELVGNSLAHLNETEEAFEMPAQSRRQLQQAIQQIRSRQNEQRASGRQNQNPPQRPTQPRPPQQRAQPKSQLRTSQRPPSSQSEYRKYQDLQFNKIGSALGEIGSRISLFERSLGEQQNSGKAIADMASQMEQLCGVVEHLANNIGEQSQIKRLETQIALLVDAIPQGNDLDFLALNQRLDVLSNAFEKLQDLQTRQQDLQTRQIELSINASENCSDMSAIETGVQNIYEKMDDLELGEANFEPIEKAVRAIYDRIDSLEKTTKQPNPDIEWLSRDMADFTKAMKNGTGANNSNDLIERVDALVGRIEQIEIQGGAVGSLKSEMKNLQTSLLNVMEPRFEALEQKLGNLSNKQANTAKNSAKNTAKSSLNPDISVDILEEHIKALAGKIDKTNSQLNGLQQVFSKQNEGNQAPDFDSIAEIVAAKTSQAVEKLQSKADNNADQTSLQQNALEQMENRLSSLFEKQTRQNKPEEFSNVQKNIEQVNKRLARLEETLSDQGDKLPDSKFAKDFSQQPDTLIVAPKQSFEDRGDNMPHSPVEERPLNAPVFNGAVQNNIRVPIPASLRVDPDDLMVTESEVHEIDEPHPARHSPYASNDFSAQTDEENYTGETIVNPIKLPSFNDENTDVPPAPDSAFASGSNNQNFDLEPNGEFEQTSRPKSQNYLQNDLQTNLTEENFEPEISEERASRSTFIEAARRAVKANTGAPEEEGEQSLIGRAMARFQRKSAVTKQGNQENETESGQIPASSGTVYGQNNSLESRGLFDEDEFDDLTTVPESFLSRNSRPILLGAAIVAVTLLTINLVSQRFSPPSQTNDAMAEIDNRQAPNAVGVENSPQEGTPQINNNDGAKSETPNKTTSNLNSSAIDRPVGATDTNVRIIDPLVNQETPVSLNLASLTSVGATQPVAGIEMPPEEIGPLLLRQTARDGDPRAQFEIGAIFAEGRAINQDLAAAAIWYERSAAQGFAPAGYRLANMLENGVGVEKDLARARLWYQLAAEAGNRMSMHNLASLMASGLLGEPEFDVAAYWFEKAANLGLKDSQFNLAMLNARGLGVPQNPQNAFKWFSIAANLGDEDAAKARDDIARSLDALIVSNMQNEISIWEPSALNIRANFAPIGTWSPDFDPGPKIDNPEVIVRVQAVLNRLGFDSGVPDGVIGPKTSGAISSFENSIGMEPSGEINPRLLAVLGSQPV